MRIKPSSKVAQLKQYRHQLRVSTFEEWTKFKLGSQQGGILTSLCAYQVLLGHIKTNLYGKRVLKFNYWRCSNINFRKVITFRFRSYYCRRRQCDIFALWGPGSMVFYNMDFAVGLKNNCSWCFLLFHKNYISGVSTGGSTFWWHINYAHHFRLSRRHIVWPASAALFDTTFSQCK